MHQIQPYDYSFLALLRKGPIERRPGGWRFGTKRIADHIVERMIAAGDAVRDGDIVQLAPRIRR